MTNLRFKNVYGFYEPDEHFEFWRQYMYEPFSKFAFEFKGGWIWLN